MSENVASTGGRAEGGAEGAEAQERKAGGPFGGFDPAEAGRKRWALERERKAALAAEPEDDGLIAPVPVRHRKIVSTLEREAAKGDVQAARELRAWLDKYPPKDVALTPDELPREMRERLLARLLREIGEEEGQSVA